MKPYVPVWVLAGRVGGEPAHMLAARVGITTGSALRQDLQHVLAQGSRGQGRRSLKEGLHTGWEPVRNDYLL